MAVVAVRPKTIEPTVYPVMRTTRRTRPGALLVAAVDAAVPGAACIGRAYVIANGEPRPIRELIEQLDTPFRLELPPEVAQTLRQTSQALAGWDRVSPPPARAYAALARDLAAITDLVLRLEGDGLVGGHPLIKKEELRYVKGN